MIWSVSGGGLALTSSRSTVRVQSLTSSLEASTAVHMHGEGETIPAVLAQADLLGFALYNVLECHEFAPWLQVKCDLLLIRRSLLPHFTPLKWGPACVLVPDTRCGDL
mmetsp:Transcript_85107/g.153295  ORF Transcript_85107/g.153295 Transcript_85107/m.153295 type:complete len:108 (+) Transcript_85107:160-483(+)